jgi:hypothetical protein
MLPMVTAEYIPTTDGPAHLYTATILRDIGIEGSILPDFFEVSLYPLPNWSTQVYFVALSHLVGLRSAEKILLLIYGASFSVAFVYIARGLGRFTWPYLVIATQLMLTTTLWLGFYNFAFGVIALLVTAGYLVRQSDLSWKATALLFVFFTITYFTHLLAFVMSLAIACLVVVLRMPRRSWFRVPLASIPLLLLAIHYFATTGMNESSMSTLFDIWRQNISSGFVSTRFLRINQYLFQIWDVHGWGGAFLAVILGLTLLMRVLYPDWFETVEWPVVSLCVFALLAAMFLLTPEHLSHSIEHGGVLAVRFCFVASIFSLLCLPIPKGKLKLGVLGCAITFFLGNQIGMASYVSRASIDIREFVSGIPYVNDSSALYLMMTPGDRREGGYVKRAISYYCLDSGNVNLAHYQATVSHFQVSFKPDIPRGRGDYESYTRKDLVDYIIAWDVSKERISSLLEYDIVFCNERLTVLKKRESSVLPK